MSNSKAVRIPSNYNKSKTNLPLPPIVFSLRESARDNAVHIVTFSLWASAKEYNSIFHGGTSIILFISSKGMNVFNFAAS